MEVDSHSSTDPSSLTRHPDLWFEDGNIVIHAGATVFKVLKSMLSKESQLFKDMFSLPQSSAAGETYDGCALLHVQETAEDFCLLLSAIFHYA